MEAAIHEHTLGQKCRMAPIHRTRGEDGMPPVEAQFFYSSPIPIDDPLSTSSVSGTSDARSGKIPMRPFSRGDSNTLEKAWLGLQSESDRRDHDNARQGRGQTPTTAKASAEKRAWLVQALALKHWDHYRIGYDPQDLETSAETGPQSGTDQFCCPTLVLDISEELEKTFCALAREVDPSLDPERMLQDVMTIIGKWRQTEARSSNESHTNQADEPLAHTPNAVAMDQTSRDSSARPSSPLKPKSKPDGRSDTMYKKYPMESLREHGGRHRSGSQVTDRSSRTQTPVGSPAVTRPVGVDDGISGKPFLRVGTGGEQSPQFTGSAPRHDHDSIPVVTEGPPDGNSDHIEVLEAPGIEALKRAEPLKAKKYGKESAEVAVGVSRLHMVSLPSLQMRPIYWSPINDMAPVMRATWFYRDTMAPVPPVVANQLEAGYHELRPWTETWSDELRCAVDVGALGEEKVSHRLWPKESDVRNRGSGLPENPLISSDPYCAARCFRGEAASEGSIAPVKPKESTAEHPFRPFSNYQVMYKNEREAFLLRPSLSASAYYGRRPLAKIARGATVGIPVVRGFDRRKWERIHTKSPRQKEPKAPQTNESQESYDTGTCAACKAETDRGQVTDLVLVAHGIGQKFAERVESFHFTHAINGFRRAVNLELGSPIVQQVVREGQNGLMILPLNWRMGLSFEDGGPLQEEDKEQHATDGFGLKDIEPSTIPAVRSMISDVMFDIPFYMSHHKGKMIKALVSEANRVYRLWCRNNPGFAEKGRVHLIAHSLGSVMALDVLSRQPTEVPRLDLSRNEPETTFFEFDTKNLFLAGSPAGFFLLLERGALIPRRNRRKPGADRADTVASGVVAETGTFGCLAVDNIYNVLAKEDPIAYLLNGAVDSTYAASLKVAHVPTTATSFFQSVGNAFRSVLPGMGPAGPPSAADAIERPPTFRLPSQLELEVHDFTREEIAEKKFYLLNDNGQIDWYLRSGGGPLEIQYLNMLSAHTSYWTNHDFIRMICMEIGRKPGRENTLPAMRAAKAPKRLLK